MKFGYEGASRQAAAKGWMELLKETLLQPLFPVMLFRMGRILYSKCSVKDYSYGFNYIFRLKYMGGN